jgi:hemoglobin
MNLQVALATESPALFDRIGGWIGIVRIVDGLYERILADPQLEPFFRRADLASLKRSQTTFLARAFGGARGRLASMHDTEHVDLDADGLGSVFLHLHATLVALPLSAELTMDLMRAVLILALQDGQQAGRRSRRGRGRREAALA